MLRSKQRQGAATVELAILLPFLLFLFVITIDFGRVFYYAITITNCARDGALYASDPVTQKHSTYSVYDPPPVLDLTASVARAAKAEAPAAVQEHIEVMHVITSDADGRPNMVSVTVVYPFHTISRVPGIPDTFKLRRTVTMRMVPEQPS